MQKTEMLRWYLESGSLWEFTGMADPETPEGDQQLRAVWHRIGHDFTARWIEDHPGTRPWAWWRVSAPERRRCVSGEHPFDAPCPGRAEAIAAKRPHALKLRLGVPAGFYPDETGIDYETEADYLSRLGLLTYEESVALEQREMQEV